LFENISKRFGSIFSGLQRTGILRSEDIENAIREIRISLLEADISLAIVKEFINNLKEQAVGQQVVKSITPDQLIIKMVNDQLVSMLSENNRDVLEKSHPKRIMLVGLQGVGKTTVAAKLASMLKQKKVMTATCDIYRPAAAEQLRILSEKAGAEFFSAALDIGSIDIVKKTLEAFKTSNCQTLIMDTAGRLHTDADMMQELDNVHKAFDPDEVFLVVDSMMGQDAVKMAQQFAAVLKITGVVMTRVDADTKGGAIISIGKATSAPIVFLSTGEKLSDIERFDPVKIAKKILGIGDVVSLIEQIGKTAGEDEEKGSSARLMRGGFDLNDLAKQIQTLSKMGGVSSILGMLPGIGSLIEKANAKTNSETMVKRQLSIIQSMTGQERKDYRIIKGSRKRRIATGSGTSVQEVNKLLRNFETMLGFIKRFKGNRITQNQIQQLLSGKVL
jgi:signal recognition particle subunit SRP54